MHSYVLSFIIGLVAFGCIQEPKTVIAPWVPYDEAGEIAINANHESKRMQYRLIQSKVSDKNELWKQIAPQIAYFGEEDYQALKPLILDQDMLTLQGHIEDNRLTYEQLTQWFLYRIATYENDTSTYLNNILAINPNATEVARRRDRNKSEDDSPLYGMPILLKDNINFDGLPTTAGTHLLRNNVADNAFIVDRILEEGGIILGKTSLSEWANFMCLGCPNGFSAVGGQTLNPYGRKIFDTGGSSSGSGSAVAAHYAVAAIGTETSGSILSPSSQSSLVGLKPTTGRLSRRGIVPLSSTLDTPGPMTKTVLDNAILMSALTGEDPSDPSTLGQPQAPTYWEEVKGGSLAGVVFGVNQEYMQDSLYALAVHTIEIQGGILAPFEPADMDWTGFVELLCADMQEDLPVYLSQYASDSLTSRTVADIVAYNQQDSVQRMPYGQGRLAQIVATQVTEVGLDSLRHQLRSAGRHFFESVMAPHQIDVILSINNRNAGQAAAANYPCITVPMGYRSSGEPVGLTFISTPFEENRILQVAYAFEQSTQSRTTPKNYQ